PRLHASEEARSGGPGDGAGRARAAAIGQGALFPRQRAAQSKRVEGLASGIRHGAVARRGVHAGVLPRRTAGGAVRIELRARRRGYPEVSRIPADGRGAGPGAGLVLAGNDSGETGAEGAGAGELHQLAEARPRLEGRHRSAEARLVSARQPELGVLTV